MDRLACSGARAGLGAVREFDDERRPTAPGPAPAARPMSRRLRGDSAGPSAAELERLHDPPPDRRDRDPGPRLRGDRGRPAGPGRGGRRRRPGVLGRRPDLAERRRPVPSRAGRSCRMSMRPGCCPCSRPGRSCPGMWPGSSGEAASSSPGWPRSTGRTDPAAGDRAAAVLVLAFPIGANLDTGNVTMLLALGLWAAQFLEARLAGLIWALATWMKWFPAPFWLLLAPRARTWGLLWLALAGVLSVSDPAAHDHPAPGPVRIRAARRRGSTTSSCCGPRSPGCGATRRPWRGSTRATGRPRRPGLRAAWRGWRRRWSGDPRAARPERQARDPGRSSASRTGRPGGGQARTAVAPAQTSRLRSAAAGNTCRKSDRSSE